MNQWYLTGGDFGFFWQEQLASVSWLPTVYRPDIGFGLSQLSNLWLGYPYYLCINIMTSLGISWWWIEKILWAGVIILGIYSSYRLARYIFVKQLPAWISSIIYITNTYVILLFGGRQLGVALAYSLSPFVLLQFIKQIDCWETLRVSSDALWKNGIKNGLWLALLVSCDLRLAYLVMGMIILYFVFSILYLVLNKKFIVRNTIYQILHTIAVPLFVAAIVHLFWILPSLMVRVSGMFGGEEYTNVGMLRFLSVADFSHALSFLHPNWPENLFGKVYFLKPEFLVLPILAFSSLLFVNKLRGTPLLRQLADSAGQADYGLEKNNASFVTRNFITFFALLSLLGAFFAKGAQDPFGGIFVWCFQHIPGFIMFRDPTKFYLFIALGYSILIPFTLLQMYYWIHDKRFMMNERTKNIKPFIFHLLSFIFIIFWCFTLRDLWSVRQMFAPLQLTTDYIQLKDRIDQDSDPYRTLWLPHADKFFYSSALHPVLAKDDLWKNASLGAVLQTIAEPSFVKTIGQAGVRYVIIPQDLEKRMFLSDYQFDRTQRDALIAAVSNSGLSRRLEFQNLAVFENTSYTFVSDTPSYVQTQEYWSRVGLGISGVFIMVIVGVFLVYKRKT